MTKPKLITEFVRLVLEAGMGTTLAADEMTARIAYENAIRAMAAWQTEKRKRDAFFAAIHKLGVNADTVRAKRLKAEDPDTYAYDQKVLQTAEASLRGALSKTRARLAMFDPAALDNDIPAKDRTSREEGVDMKMPDAKKKVYMPVEKLDPLTMYSWNDKRWASVVSRIPLGFGKEEGSRPGEERLAAILGGQTQGDNVSFDIVTKNGRRWEVKGIRKPSDQIRPQALGMKAFAAASKELSNLCDQIKDFVEDVKNIGIDKVMTKPEQRRLFFVIERFVSDEIENFDRGEISYERFNLLRRALKAAGALKKSWLLDVGETKDETLSIAGKDVKVSRQKYIAIARNVHKANPQANILDLIDSRERLLALLWSSAFDDPDAWLDKWDESIDVDRIFSDVSGVFVVTLDGFFKIPRKMLKQVFKLARISKGVPLYSVDV